MGGSTTTYAARLWAPSASCRRATLPITCGCLDQHRFDLGELDPVTANFDLAVEAPASIDLTDLIETAEVARAIKALVLLCGETIKLDAVRLGCLR